MGMEGILSPLPGLFPSAAGTQRSRAGLLSVGPPGLGPWLRGLALCGRAGAFAGLPKLTKVPVPFDPAMRGQGQDEPNSKSIPIPNWPILMLPP
jgi:hypothetical protein